MRTQSLNSTFTARRGRPGLLAAITRILATWRQRRGLSRLDRAALDDLGLSPREAAREAKKPIWDVPNHWRA